MLLVLGITVVVLGIIADVARGVRIHPSGTLFTHLVILLGALSAARGLTLGAPAGGWVSRWLRRLGTLAGAVVVLAVFADLALPGRSVVYWLSWQHALIAAATGLLIVAALSLVLRGPRNVAGRAARPGLLLAVHLAALLLLLIMVIGADDLGRPNLWRSPAFYLPSSALFPALLSMMAGRFDGKWGATLTAGWYTLLAWGLPTLLIVLDTTLPGAAQAFTPPPMLIGLLFPALAIDLSVRIFDRPVTRSLGAAVAFLGLFVAVHWFVAPRILGSAAADLYPALDRWPLGREPDWPHRLWVVLPGRRADLVGITLAGLLATVSAYAGFRTTAARRAFRVREQTDAAPGDRD